MPPLGDTARAVIGYGATGEIVTVTGNNTGNPYTCSATSYAHALGDQVNIALTKTALETVIDERADTKIATHSADTTVQHGITDFAQVGIKNAAQTWTLAQIFSALLTANAGITIGSGQLLLPSGSAATPSQAYTGGTTHGGYLTGTALGFATSGVSRATISATGINTPFNLTATGGVFGGMGSVGASTTIGSATANILVVSQASSTIVLPSLTSWTQTSSPRWLICDFLGLLTAGGRCDVYPWDDQLGAAAGDFNDINGATAVPYGNNWSGAGALAGGLYAPLATRYGIWMLTRARLSTGTGAVGGFTIIRLGTLGV